MGARTFALTTLAIVAATAPTAKAHSHELAKLQIPKTTCEVIPGVSADGVFDRDEGAGTEFKWEYALNLFDLSLTDLNGNVLESAEANKKFETKIINLAGDPMVFVGNDPNKPPLPQSDPMWGRAIEIAKGLLQQCPGLAN